MTVGKYKENLMKIGVLLGQVAPGDKELYDTLTVAMWFGDVVNGFNNLFSKGDNNDEKREA